MTDQQKDLWKDISTDEMLMDLSDLSPTDQKELRDTVNQITQIFVKKWGKFMPQETKDFASEIASRVFVTEPNNFDPVYKHLQPSRSKNDDELDISQDIPMGLNESKAIVFEEQGCDYYANRVAKRMGYNIIVNSDTKLYQRLIRQYGDLVHRVFFGTASDEETFKVIHSLSINLENRTDYLTPDYFNLPLDEQGDDKAYEMETDTTGVSGTAFFNIKTVVCKRRTHFRGAFKLWEKALISLRIPSLHPEEFLNKESTLKLHGHEIAHLLQNPVLDTTLAEFD